MDHFDTADEARRQRTKPGSEKRDDVAMQDTTSGYEKHKPLTLPTRWRNTEQGLFGQQNGTHAELSSPHEEDHTRGLESSQSCLQRREMNRK